MVGQAMNDGSPQEFHRCPRIGNKETLTQPLVLHFDEFREGVNDGLSHSF